MPSRTSMDPVTNHSPNLSNSSPPALGEASSALGGSAPPVGDSPRSLGGPGPARSASAPILPDHADGGVMIPGRVLDAIRGRSPSQERRTPFVVG